MTGLELASAFSTIVQLIGQFKQGRDQAAADSEESFMEWLSTNRHDDVIHYLQQNSRTLVAVRIALSENQHLLVGMLGEIDRKMAILAASTIALQPLATAIYPDSQLSNAAMEFLREFENSGSAEAMDLPTLVEGPLIVTIDGPGASVQFRHSRWRFFEDDVSTMVRLGFLQLKEHPAKGNRIFVLTRKGADFVNVLNLGTDQSANRWGPEVKSTTQAGNAH